MLIDNRFGRSSFWGFQKSPILSRWIYLGNKIYLLFPSSLNTDGAGGWNPPLGRHWPIYPVWSISLLLMPWRLTSPGHQQPRFRPILTKTLKYFGFVTRWVKHIEQTLLDDTKIRFDQLHLPIRKIPKSLEYNNSLTSETQLYYTSRFLW